MKLSASGLVVAVTAVSMQQASSALGPCATDANISGLPFCDTSLPFSTRAADLLSRLTPAEKLSQMGSVAAAVPRLGLPAVPFDSEAGHGIVSACVPSSKTKNCDCPAGAGGACTGDCDCPTVWPAPISLGATFDSGLWASIGSAVGREGRALAAFGGVGPAATPVGAVYRAPNVNVLRDGRWGRAQELVGEDPHVIAKFAQSYLGGLQFTSHKANASAYVLGLGVCKYFAGYSLDCATAAGQACAPGGGGGSGSSGSGSGSGSDASAGDATVLVPATFDASISPWDLSESYLPAFRACAQDALAGGVECAVNSVNGVPSCADAALLNATLRGAFDFEGFVVAAAGALAAVAKPFHNFTQTAQEAAAAVLRAGTDSDADPTGGFAAALQGALAAGLVAEADVDAAVARLLVARLRLGGLDFAAGSSAFGAAKLADLSTPTHVALNERASFEGVVLLQNNVTNSSSSSSRRRGNDARGGGGGDDDDDDDDVIHRRLPLHISGIKKLAVVGPHADARLNLLGSGHGSFPAGSLVSPADFIASRFPAGGVLVAPGCNVSSGDPAALAAAVAAAQAADVVVAGLGLCGAAPGQGDATCADAAGYYEAPGYDRASVALPQVQVDLVRALAATGTPIVVFLLNGGPLDISAITPLVEGVVWAGYPGATGGKAVGSSFLGLLSPGSVMPYTTHFAADTERVDYANMSMRAGAGRTYKFFTGEAAVPFGFGLSYSAWKGTCTGPKTGTVAEDAAALYTVELTNSGPYSGDRVVLLFAKPRVPASFDPHAILPEKVLADFARVRNAPVGSQTAVHLHFNASEDALLFNSAGEPVSAAGEWALELQYDGVDGVFETNLTVTKAE